MTAGECGRKETAMISRGKLSRAGDWILHLFLPNRCMFCGTPIAYDRLRCETCQRDAPRTDPSVCVVCEKKDCICHTAFDCALAPFFYEMGVEKAVRDLKFHNNLLNARKLGQDMAECLRRSPAWGRVQLLIPVPLYDRDYWKRGYNQAEELGKWVSRATGIPMDAEVLEKIRKTGKQHELGARERRTNLTGAFRVSAPEKLRGKTVLLVDDVLTTGTTMDVCARALKESGAEGVICLAAAKTRKAALPANSQPDCG